MPVPAAGLADVGAADPDPAVILRGGEHVVQKFAVGLLEEGALGKGAPGFGEAGRERVADLLQLAEVEDARRPDGVDPVRDVDAPHPLGDQPGELPLELADLPPQLIPRASLVGDPRNSCHPLGYESSGPACLPVEQIWHMQILSRLEGRGGNP